MAFGLELEVKGTGVRKPLAGGDFDVGSSYHGIEQRDFEAFREDGWRFKRDSTLSRFSELASKNGWVEAGMLARRKTGGLVIVRNRLVIGFHPGADIEPILARYFPAVQRLPYGDLWEVQLPLRDEDMEKTVEGEMAFLRGSDAVRAVEPVIVFHLRAPDMTRLPLRRLDVLTLQEQMSLISSTLQPDSRDQWQWLRIGAPAAWEVSTGKEIVVAVIDDGFFDDSVLKTPQLPHSKLLSLDEHGDDRAPLAGALHGTFCAGLVGSPRDGNFGNGVAPDCTMLFVAVSTVMNSVGYGKALHRCMTEGADVITCSLGPYSGSWFKLEALTAAIDDVHNNGRNKKGIVVVWAVRNNEVEITDKDLESYDPLLCVGPTDIEDGRGPSSYGAGLDLLAPGIGVAGLFSEDGVCFSVFAVDGGASFAAPQVAGSIALVLSINRQLGYADVTKLILDHCDLKPLNPPDPKFGWGRLNVQKALDATRRLVEGNDQSVALSASSCPPKGRS